MNLHEDFFVALRRDLHRHPELSFAEHRTGEIVARLLEQFGYRVERGYAGSGVVGELTRGALGRRIGLRADMDALPIQEAGNAGWASETPGVMHACGHDGHTVMLLAAANELARDDRIDGTVTLIFQPAEEYGQADSGAARMIAEGLFEKHPCDCVFAFHNAPGIPQGVLAFREGPALAASDHVVVTLMGQGGHGGMPHLAVDPVPAAASLIQALQTIVSRNADPLESAVVSVAVVQAGTTHNVIPHEVRIELSVRAFSQEMRDLVERRVREIVAGHAASFGVGAEIAYNRGYPPLRNSAQETRFARKVAQDLPGAVVLPASYPLITGSEDFAFMLERRPGALVLIGNGTEGAHGASLHHPTYDFNDAILPAGARYLAALARRYLTPEAGPAAA